MPIHLAGATKHLLFEVHLNCSLWYTRIFFVGQIEIPNANGADSKIVKTLLSSILIIFHHTDRITKECTKFEMSAFYELIPLGTLSPCLWHGHRHLFVNNWHFNSKRSLLNAHSSESVIKCCVIVCTCECVINNKVPKIRMKLFYDDNSLNLPYQKCMTRCWKSHINIRWLIVINTTNWLACVDVSTLNTWTNECFKCSLYVFVIILRDLLLCVLLSLSYQFDIHSISPFGMRMCTYIISVS